MGMKHIYRWEDSTKLTGAEKQELRTRLNDATALFYLRLQGQGQGADRIKVQRLAVRSCTINYYDVRARRHMSVPCESVTEIVAYALGRVGRFIATPEQIKEFLMSFNSAPMPATCAPRPATAFPTEFVRHDPTPTAQVPWPQEKSYTEVAQEQLERAQAALANAIETDAKIAAAAEAAKAKTQRLLDLATDAGQIKALQLLVQDITELTNGVTQYPVQRLEYGKFFDFSSLHDYAAYYGYELVKTGNGTIATIVQKGI